MNMSSVTASADCCALVSGGKVTRPPCSVADVEAVLQVCTHLALSVQLLLAAGLCAVNDTMQLLVGGRRDCTSQHQREKAALAPRCMSKRSRLHSP